MLISDFGPEPTGAWPSEVLAALDPAGGDLVFAVEGVVVELAERSRPGRHRAHPGADFWSTWPEATHPATAEHTAPRGDPAGRGGSS